MFPSFAGSGAANRRSGRADERRTTGTYGMKLGWKQAYETGIPEIDEQHVGLLKLINDLDAFRDHPPGSHEIFNTLNALVAYAEGHFATEERYMERLKYPQILPHKRQHVAFLGTVFRFARQLEEKDPDVFSELVTFLRDWYGAHIGNSDREYKEFFIARGYVRPPSA
jgi:hemerythrin